MDPDPTKPATSSFQTKPYSLPDDSAASDTADDVTPSPSRESNRLAPSRPTPPSQPLPKPEDDLVRPGSIGSGEEGSGEEPAKPKPMAPPPSPPKPSGTPEPPAASPQPGGEELQPATPPGTFAPQGKALLVAGPLFLVASLAVSAYMVLKPPAQQPAAYPVSVDTGVTIDSEADYIQYAPTNPTTVKAYADSTKRQTLTSEQAYSYPNPYFEWSGSRVNEPGANILGYMVVFGETYDPNSSIVLLDNHFSPQSHGITLEKGKTYSLYVHTITNGKASLGIDPDKPNYVTQLFSYTYQ